MTQPSLKVKVRFRSCRKACDTVATPDAPDGPSPIARRLALAHRIENLIEHGELDGYADAARRFGLTRARITQVCNLALLAPDLQDVVLLGQVRARDRHLREVGRHRLWTDQRQAFDRLFPGVLEALEEDPMKASETPLASHAPDGPETGSQQNVHNYPIKEDWPQWTPIPNPQ